MSDPQQVEGAAVVDHQAKLPATTVECDYYEHGTVLRLAVEVRVRGMAYDEDKDGNLVRLHKLAFNDIEIVGSYSPAQANDTVEGSASSTPAQTQDDSAELGLEIGRSSDQWPAGVMAAGEVPLREGDEEKARSYDARVGF